MKRLMLWAGLLVAAGLILVLTEKGQAVPEFLGTRLVSIVNGGGASNGDSSYPDSSHSGRYVVFESNATNLVGGDNNGVTDVFLRDMITQNVYRLSRHSNGTAGNGASQRPVVSGDGRYIAFHSAATNLVDGDTNNATDVFVHDRLTGQTSRVSVATGGAQANAPSYDPDISADGRYITFWSLASNLATLDNNGKSDVFVHDRNTGQTFRVSVASNGQQGNDDSSHPTISDDGRYVAFESYASNFVANDLDGYKDIFVHDWQGLSTIRLSVNISNAGGLGDSYDAAIAGDGSAVVFTSLAANLVGSDTNGNPDVFLRDRVGNNTERISVDSNEAQANGTSEQAVLSDNARYVAYRSNATNLVSGDSNNIGDVFVRDRTAGTTERASLRNDGGQANDASDQPTMTANGDLVFFRSKATNLVSGDTNGARDIFERDRRIPPPELSSDFYIGKPGSEFLFTGRYFTPNITATVKANEVIIGQVTADGNGSFQFTFCYLASAPNGVAMVRVEAGAQAAEQTVRVHSDAPLRGPTGVTPLFCLANSAILDIGVNLPIIRR